jgi:UDP-N-acetylmuramoylalanine--D-glutamate ligase
VHQNLTVVIGLGKTGLSCIRYLLQQGYNIAVIDSRENPPCLEEFKKNFSQVPLILGAFDANLLAQAKELIVSPGLSLQEPSIAKQISKGILAIGDIELFARYAIAPIVGVTGTNGKSTVTTLVGERARNAGLNVRVGGNLGTPALDLLDDQAELYVLELSSFQLETTYSLKTAAAVVLNITPDHMDRYATLAEYIAAKQRIYLNCKIPVINRDDKTSYSGLMPNVKAISFGLNESHQDEFGLRPSPSGETYLTWGDRNLLSIDELQIKGRHQVANALAALALGQAVNLPMDVMLQTLKTFKGLIHRCQWVANIDGVDWYNDSKGTNVNSTLAGIEGLGGSIKGKLILIAGGLGKQQDFSPLRLPIAKYVKTVVLIGQDAKLISQALDNVTQIKFAESLEQAVIIAKQTATKGDAVLLSPACASFDMFRNFEHRGEVFIALVLGLRIADCGLREEEGKSKG